jgi:hypothetical protein
VGKKGVGVESGLFSFNHCMASFLLRPLQDDHWRDARSYCYKVNKAGVQSGKNHRLRAGPRDAGSYSFDYPFMAFQSAAHSHPNSSTWSHRRRRKYCAILLTFTEIFSHLFDYVTSIWSLLKRAGNPSARAISLRVSLRQPLHVAWRSVACSERTEPMLPPNKPRDLARSLVASEADASTTSLQTEPATVRVYERLRRQLSSPVGIDGFQALASRALALAKSQSQRLSAVQVTANGGLRGLGEIESETDANEDGEAGIILIAQLLGLFLTFLGEATTLRLIEDLRIQVEVIPASARTTDDLITTSADGPVMAAAFEDLLLEIDRLRIVGQRIEALADRHPGMEDGLVSVAGNISSIASVLDVFTLIRSKAGGPQDEAPDLQTNRYMN